MLRARDTIWLTTLALLCFGVVMVSSAGMSVGREPGQGVTLSSILASRPSVYMALSLAALGIGASLRLRDVGRSSRRARWIPLLWPASLAGLALVYLPGIGHEVNGSARWIALPGRLTIQPSEFAKWAMPLVMAWYCWRHASIMDRLLRGLAPALVALGTVVVIVTLEDLGTGVLIAAVGTLILIAGGARIWHFILLSPIALLGALAAIASSPYRLERISSWLDPFADPKGSGYHIIQSLVAIANGRISGRGLGFGLQKFGYLPEDRTDFLFAIVCEELGVAGAALALALFAALILGCASIARRQTTPLLKLYVIGVTATIALHAVMNLLVVTGLAPTKGIALPMMSAGGTGWVLTAFNLGLVASLDRPAEAPEPARAVAQPAAAAG